MKIHQTRRRGKTELYFVYITWGTENKNKNESVAPIGDCNASLVNFGIIFHVLFYIFCLFGWMRGSAAARKLTCSFATRKYVIYFCSYFYSTSFNDNWCVCVNFSVCIFFRDLRGSSPSSVASYRVSEFFHNCHSIFQVCALFVLRGIIFYFLYTEGILLETYSAHNHS